MLTDSDTGRMKVIITLLKPFKECGEKLSSETNVTISLVIPLFEKLKEHLKNNGLDCGMITDMKATMLAKLKTRYSSDEMQRLKTCTILDVRNKCIPKVLDHYAQFEQHMKDIVLASQVVESQQEIPATEGQELANLSAFSVIFSADHSIFDFEDDASMDDNIPRIEIDNIPAEI